MFREITQDELYELRQALRERKARHLQFLDLAYRTDNLLSADRFKEKLLACERLMETFTKHPPDVLAQCETCEQEILELVEG